MGYFTSSRTVSITLLVLLGMTVSSATRAILFPQPYGGYGGGYGAGFGGFGGGFGGYPGFGGGFPGYGGGYGGIKHLNAAAGAGSGNEHENQAGGKHITDFGYGSRVFGEGDEKGHDYGIGEGTGFGAGGHEEKGAAVEGVGHQEGEEIGFGQNCEHKSSKVQSGTTP